MSKAEELIDCLEGEIAKRDEELAAPVGEREAFEAWLGIKPCGAAHDLAVMAFKARAACQRQSDWQASGADYDHAIHCNPDANAWADLFVSTFPALTDKHELMLGWFANAMMAMHDFLKSQQRQSGVVTDAVRAVLAERQRQISAEGWTPEHDDEHGSGQLADAAACYALSASGMPFELWQAFWPWDGAWLKAGEGRRSLVKAGALILAEIERLDRLNGGSHE